MNKERMEQILKSSKLIEFKKTHGLKDTVGFFKNEEDEGYYLYYIAKNYALEKHIFQTEKELLQILRDLETRFLNIHKKIGEALKPFTDHYPEYIKKVNENTYELGHTQIAFGLSNISPAAGEYSKIISFKELENYSPHNHIGLILNPQTFPTALLRYMVCFMCKNEFEKHYGLKNNPWVRGFNTSLIDFYLATYKMAMEVAEKEERWILRFTAKTKHSDQVLTTKSVEGSLDELMAFTASYAKRKRKEDRLNHILN